MYKQFPQKAQEIMNARFRHDALIALATTDDGIPWVRTVDGYYEDGAFYVISYTLSNKMQQIKKNPTVAVCGEWFTAHGVGENMGYILDKRNEALASKLRTAFRAWYDNGHIDESDPNTCILCIHLTDGILLSDGEKYVIDFRECAQP